MMARKPVTLALVVLGALALICAPLMLKNYGVYLLSQWAVYVIAAIGLNLMLGYAGQVSLAQGAFVGIGAYSSAILTTHGWPLGLVVIVALALCFAVGWVLGYPALRVRHHYLAFVTLAFSTLAFLVFRNEEWLTGGIYGISGVPRPNLFGLDLSRPIPFYEFCLAVLAIVTAAMAWLIRSPWGRAFTALRENPVRALSLGIDTRLYTLMAFAIGSALAGLAGVVYAPLVQFVDPPAFALQLSLSLLLMVIVGGQGYFFGPFLGAAVAVLLPEWLRFADNYYLVIYALVVMVLMALCPQGLIGLGERIFERLTVRAAEPRKPA
ncbi:amino acid/amide ABC transporter membrane protein 2, HAAT family [Rhizobiales bacterium GAS191]|nr:amino acid/amide ABC transporter membrane protein 2, HAAT family [Rhizobiales bacterium GAS113]SEB97853.1 amino acid/amide ABC transporter membrane protein 2, HAAT family [Rhizobiales bacterium GAS191]SED20515.1 amino acid/amide ABC transporter membrane protein 2, HAAT family [Rhizobiales bacterium GAS188]